VFCDRQSLEWRTIRSNQHFVSLVSKPWFRRGHCLVIPARHITSPAELNAEEAVAIMVELGRLSALLDEGYGTGIMQKFQPLQSENGIKVNHLHFHAFPRLEVEQGLFPTPSPNSFDGFITPSDDEVTTLAVRLR
jgi:diadenosine tetraphosphate (Ap4A) HIT family hydrolase